MKCTRMSTITDSETMDGGGEDEESPTVGGVPTYSLAAPVRLLGFWTAVALPFLYVPLLATGLESPGQRQTFILLLALNVAALFVGHRHRDA